MLPFRRFKDCSELLFVSFFADAAPGLLGAWANSLAHVYQFYGRFASVVFFMFIFYPFLISIV